MEIFNKIVFNGVNGFMTRIVFALCVLCIIFAHSSVVAEAAIGAASRAYNTSGDCHVVAAVDEKPITNCDVMREMLFLSIARNIDLSSLNQHDFTQLRSEALEVLIDDRVILLESKRTNVTISEEEIDNWLANSAKQQGTDTDNFVKYFKSMKVEDELRNFIRRQLFLQEFVRAAVKSALYVSNAEINENLFRVEQKRANQIAELEKIVDASAKSDRSSLEADDTVSISQIVVSPDMKVADNTNGAVKAGAIMEELAGKILNDIRSGMTFTTMLKEYNQNQLKAQSSSLGWIKIADLSPQYHKVISHMRKGELGGPIMLDGAVVVVMVVDVKRQHIVNQNEVNDAQRMLSELRTMKLDGTFIKNEAENVLRETKVQMYVSSYFKKVRDMHFIKVFNSSDIGANTAH